MNVTSGQYSEGGNPSISMIHMSPTNVVSSSNSRFGNAQMIVQDNSGLQESNIIQMHGSTQYNVSNFSMPPGSLAGSHPMGGPGSISGGANASTQRKPCNCNKSNCLKLYCECFSQGQLCQNCNCSNCMNNLKYESERSRAVKMILERNPMAFHPKIGRGEGERRHTKGCNCKRSGCLKNYCECYEAKISCSELCRCQGCRNTEESIERRSLLRLHSMELNRLKYGTAVTKHLVKHSVETLPHMFMTWEVIEATAYCLLSRASEAERRDQSPAAQEEMIIRELGRCLQQVVDASAKAQASSGFTSQFDSGGLLSSDRDPFGNPLTTGTALSHMLDKKLLPTGTFRMRRVSRVGTDDIMGDAALNIPPTSTDMLNA